MTPRIWHDLGPNLLLAGGIVAGQSAQAAWFDLAGSSLLAACLLLADALMARVRGMPPKPSLAACILASAFVLAGLLALLREPGHTGSLIPVLGLGAWTILFLRDGKSPTPCTIA